MDTLKFHVETFGCQMNQNDSELMSLSLTEKGMYASGSLENADIVVFNTCSVRENAEKRVIAKIKTNRKTIRDNNGVIIVTGCMAQRIGEQLIKEKIADIVIGPYQSPHIGDILDIYFKSKDKNVFLSQEMDDFSGRINTRLSEFKNDTPWHRWVTITHGCENNCTYCIVPSVRGKLISIPSPTILDYINILTHNGVKEITLLGQNVNQYGQDNEDIPFHKLLEEVAKIEGLVRINFLTSHPKDFSEEAIKVIKDYPNISRSIHLPMQSGSNNILKRMNRKYTAEHYLELVELLDKHLDDYAISTDLIVGFPGETEEDYQETLSIIKKIKFDEAFMYAYSPREGTPGFNLKETLTEKEKQQRLQNLIDTQREIAHNKLKKRIGTIEDVIIERVSKKSNSHVFARSFLNHSVVLPGNISEVGRLMRVEIESIAGSTLKATRVAH